MGEKRRDLNSISQEQTPIEVYKKENKLIVAAGDIVDFEIHIKNLASKTLYNILVNEEVSFFIDILSGTLIINDNIIENYHLSKGININQLQVNEEIIIKYKAIINQTKKEVQTKLRYTYEYFYFEKKVILQGEVLSNKIKVQNVQLQINKLVSKKKVLLGDEVKLIIKIKNIGELVCYNILIKEDLCENLSFIEGSFEFDNRKFNIANILKGVNIGGLSPLEEKTIKYKVRINKGINNEILNTKINGSFEYSLNGSYLIERKKLINEELKFKVDNPIITEFINEYFILMNEPNVIKQILDVSNELEIIDFYIIDTVESLNLEGRNFRGKSLIITGQTKIFVQYLTNFNKEVHILKDENIFVKTIPLYGKEVNAYIIKIVGWIKHINNLITEEGVLFRDFIILEGLVRET
ncbi:MAG: hypothetical protein ACRCYE_03420 [Sarcina sp.]